MKKSTLTEDKLEQTPTGGVLVGKRQGQTIIHNKGTLSGYLVGKTHAEGGIKAVNKSTGQPLEMQGGEVVITAPAVSDNTKNEFNGKMMTNREILSTINEKGGGVAFAKDGMEIPKSIKRTGATYKYGGKTMTDHEIYKYITGGHLADGMTLSQIAKMHKVSLKELQKQVDLGMKAESEHTSSKREQMKIVKDHLYENPKYYTLLKRAGLKHGGAVRRGSLVRDAKSGNTPARDLNNYNDVLDLDADGVVGAETGLYARGGKVKAFDDGGSVKETVEYVSFANYSDIPFEQFYKSKFYNFAEFKVVVKDLYYSSGFTNKRTIEFCINNINSISQLRVNVSQGKNTNSNFNPITGTFKDLEKNLKKSSSLIFDKFDWNEWGGVQNSTSTSTASKTSKPIDLLDKKIWVKGNMDLSRRVQELAFANGFESIDGKTVGNTSYGNIYFGEKANGVKYMYILDYSKDDFDKESETEIFEADLFPTAIANGKFTSGDIDAFNQIDAIVDSYNITMVEQVEWDYETSATTDFDIVNTLTGDTFQLRKYITTLGVSKEDVYIEKSKALIRNYKEWKKTQPKGTASATPITTASKTKKLITPDADSVIQIMVLDKDKTTIATANNINELLDILIKVQKDGISEVKLKYIFEDADIYRAYYITWIENVPSGDTDINPYETSPSELKIWLRKKTDIHKKKFNLTYFFSKSGTTMASTPTSTLTTQAPTSVPFDLKLTMINIRSDKELAKRVIERAKELGWTDNSSIKRKIDANDIEEVIWFGEGKYVGWGEKDFLIKNPSYREITEADLFPTATTSATPTSVTFDLSNTKIWIGDNPALSERIQKRAMELGWDWWSGDKTPKFLDYTNLFFDEINKKITSGGDRTHFDSFKDFKEITEADLFGTTSTPTSAPFNLKQKKIFIGDNPALSERIQKKAFELGWFWETTSNSVRRTNDKALFFFNDKTMLSGSEITFNSTSLEEITEADLFGTTSSQTSNVQDDMKNFDFSTLFPSGEDWAKKFTADLDKLATYLPNDKDFAPELSKEQKDLDALIKLLPSFQQSKYAIERAKILKEIKKIHNKLTYEGFIKPNEALSSDANLFTPQGLLDYYYTQATQNPTAELEPACELPTPNGEKSKLPMSAYLNVRTEQFKNWFGDWEKAYETDNYVNCSKMIDPDTKEPKIYFHGVRKFVPNFGQFSNMGQGVVRPYGAFEPPSFPASYFAGEEDYAKFYGGVAENMPTPSTDYKPFIYKVFLSVKNPISLLPLDFMLSYKDFMDYIYVGYGVKVEPNQELLRQLNNDITKKNPMWIYVRRDIGFIEKIKDYGYDALFQMGDIPTFLPSGEVEPDRTKHLQEVEYLTFYPNQVKSATVKKSFYFDFFNDIRFKNGGYVRI